MSLTCAFAVACAESGTSFDHDAPPSNATAQVAPGSDADAVASTGGSVRGADGGVVPNTAHEEPLELTMEVGELLPGQERYICQTFGNPFKEDVDIVAFEHESTFSHHHFLFMGDEFNTPTPSPYPCVEVPPAMPFAFTAQGNYVAHNYPEGMGLRIQGKTGLMMQGHYVNTSDKPVRPTVKLRLFRAKKEAVKTHVGIAFMMMGPGGVTPTPPGTSRAKPNKFPEQSCPIYGFQGQEVNVMWMVGHMHAMGVHMESSILGKKVYETEIWDDPPTEYFTPSMVLKDKTQVSWNCSYMNPTNKTVAFGDGYYDAMCAIFAGYYPADPNNPTQICFRPTFPQPNAP